MANLKNVPGKGQIVCLGFFAAALLCLTVFCGCAEASPGNENDYLRTTTPEDGIEWGNDNAVYAVPQPAYANQVLQDAENALGAFEPLDIKAVYIVWKDLGSTTEPLKLLLVLNNAGKKEQEAAVDILRADSRIKYAFECGDVPFETVNTLHLSAASDSVRVGDTLNVKPEGVLKVYQPTFAFDRASSVSLVNYNPNKKYTPADFPQVNAASVITDKYSFGTYFSLIFAEFGYFNVIKAIDALARDPAIKTICVSGYGFPGWVLTDEWDISDVSIADFANKAISGGDDQGNYFWRAQPNENGEVTIEGLKPGKVIVRYTPSMGWHMGTAYSVTREITVLP